MRHVFVFGLGMDVYRKLKRLKETAFEDVLTLKEVIDSVKVRPYSQSLPMLND